MLTSCPGGQRAGKLGAQPDASDKYAQLAAVLEDQDQFLTELARLQGLYSTPPDEAAAPPGDADLRYSLTADVSNTRAAIKLTPRESGSAASLLCWEEAEGLAGLKLVRQAEEAGGLRVELASGPALSIIVLARWVNGRYLQVSREVVLQGLDQTATLHKGGTSWRLEGPWLPYRVVPGREGPYGVVSNALTDGEWHSLTYPGSAMVPAVGAFNKTSGWWLASLDKAGKDLSRNYDLSWRIDPEYKDGGAIELGYRYFDGVADQYVQQALTAGLPVRDAVALEPVTLMEVSADPTQVSAETREMIQHLGALSRTFWFQPKPPPSLEPGSIVSLQQWVSQEDQLEDRLRTATGLWEAKLNIADIPDAKLGPTGYGGIGALDIGGGGLPEPAKATLEKLKAAGLPTVQHSPVDFVKVVSTPYAKRFERNKWLMPQGGDGATEHTVDLRNPDAAAWVLRKRVEDLEASPDIAGYSFDFDPFPSDQRPAKSPWLVSQLQARAWITLSLAERARVANQNGIVLQRVMPSLATPAYGNAVVSSARYETHLLSNPRINDVLFEVFGVHPWVGSSEGSLAANVLATTAGVGGHVLPRKLSGLAGFDAFAENLGSLRKAGGDCSVLYSDPEESTYATFRERPVEMQELIAILPGDLGSARAVWVCFVGRGGSVTLDTENNLTVDWTTGSWTERLPGGIWKIQHPRPDSVQPGDAVLVKFSPMKLAPQDGAEQG